VRGRDTLRAPSRFASPAPSRVAGIAPSSTALRWDGASARTFLEQLAIILLLKFGSTRRNQAERGDIAAPIVPIIQHCVSLTSVDSGVERTFRCNMDSAESAPVITALALVNGRGVARRQAAITSDARRRIVPASPTVHDW